MTVSYGFHYDDYHFVRPYASGEILQAFRGPWDASGIETPYYRPLTICLYAARFRVFGLNSTACHVLSLVMFASAATLFGVFATRAIGGLLPGLIAVAVFTVHPGMPYSAVAWITNQMHLMQLLVMLTAFLYWFAVRDRPARWWLPILALQAIAFLIKEDGVMLIPAILALHTLRRRVAEPGLPQVPWRFVFAAACLLAALLVLRSYALDGVRGPRLPGFDQAWTNLVRGLEGPFRLVPAKRPWQPAASWFVTLLPLTALLVWRRLSPGARFALLAGLVVGVLFDLPFVFIVKAEQLHLVTMSAAMAVAAAAAGLASACPRAMLVRISLAALLASGTTAMGAVARNIAEDFHPFGPITLRTDRIVEQWAAVPVELRDYLAAKRAPGAAARLSANPASALETVAFGLHGRETSPDGVSFRWMAGPVVDVYFAAGKRLLAIPVRHELGAFREPASVKITADGRAITTGELTDDKWHRFDVALKPRDVPAVGRMHHVRIEIDHAWIPSRIIPGSPDDRTLGLQIGALEAR